MKKILLFFLPLMLSAGESPFSKKARFDYPVKEEKPIVVLVCSYNNIDWYQRNLRSILEQDYSNYRVIYLDDNSPDGTGHAVEAFLKLHDTKGRVHLIKNQVHRGAMGNQFVGAHLCRNDEIIAIVDGDDWLNGNQVLKKINQLYANPDVWMSYGQYMHLTPYKRLKGHCRFFHPQTRGVRRHGFVSSHLRTYYAGLFKRIHMKDLMMNGKFLEVGADLAGMYPMLDMAYDHIYFVEQILYMYNGKNPINDHKKNRAWQRRILGYICSLNRYKPLHTHPSHLPDHGTCDMLLLSSSPNQLDRCLKKISQVEGLEQINVLYPYKANGYHELQKLYPAINWHTGEDLAGTFRNMMMGFKSKYIALMHDKMEIDNLPKFQEIINDMDMASALVHVIGEPLSDDIIETREPLHKGPDAWSLSKLKIRFNQLALKYPAIWRSQDLKSSWMEIEGVMPIELLSKWSPKFSQFEVGLSQSEKKSSRKKQIRGA